jgi:hypothetical protein
MRNGITMATGGFTLMQVSRLLMVASSAILMSVAAFGQSASDTVYQIHYFSNLPGTDTVINVTDSGASIGTTFAVNSGAGIAGCTPQDPCTSSGAPTTVVGNGNLCVNAYVFDQAEELVDCCTCFVTPNGLWSWDVLVDMDAATVTLGPPVTNGMVKLVATLGGTSAASCNAGLAGQPVNSINPFTGAVQVNSATNSVLAPGMVAWARGQASTSLAGGTESAFEPATLTTGELQRLTAYCAAQISPPIGVCKGCTLGGR